MKYDGRNYSYCRPMLLSYVAKNRVGVWAGVWAVLSASIFLNLFDHLRLMKTLFLDLLLVILFLRYYVLFLIYYLLIMYCT